MCWGGFPFYSVGDYSDRSRSCRNSSVVVKCGAAEIRGSERERERVG